jgi:vitamin B12 transporter
LKTIFIVCCLFSGLLTANAGSVDSVYVFHVKEIQVIGNRFDYFTEGQQVITISPQILRVFQHNSLGELLGNCGQAFIKSYGGAGSLSTISIRGASDNQTQVNWNGFPLNSVTSGDVDLSLIPVHLIDEVNIHPGASGSLYGSGTFGGSVDITSRVKANTPLSIYFDSEIGSFHDRSISAGFSQGLRKLSYNFSFALCNVLNDFTYPDVYKPGSPEVLMTHNSLKYMGIFQSLTYNFDSHNTLDLGIWYQQKMKDLPQIMGSTIPSTASQKDSSFKIFARWTRIFTHSSLTFKTAYFTDYLQYLEDTLNSRIFSRQLLGDISYRNTFSDHFSGEAGLVSRLIHADVAAYTRGIFEPRLSFYSAAKYSFGALILNFSARVEMTKGRQPKPVISAGANYSLFKDAVILRVSSSSKYRLPSLNEKYWPGANPDIFPEEGWTNEAGFILNILNRNSSVLSFESQAYSSSMKNLIQWTGLGNDLAPVNYKDVWSRGIDCNIKYNYSGTVFQASSSLGLEHLRSTNTEVYEGHETILGKQLRYVPQNRINFLTELNYSIFNLGYIYSFTGKTFITEDNSGMGLPAYGVSNIYVSAGRPIFGNDLNLIFRISNLFDKHYQVMNAYPAAGRAFSIGFSVRFDVIKKNKDSL